MFINVRIEGITPLICNKFFDEAAFAASGGTRNSSAAQERGTPQEQAEKKLYLSLRTGKPMIPQPNLLRSLIDGGTFHKVGKSQVTTSSKSMLFSCLDIDAAEIPLEYKQPWRVNTRAVVIPATKGRILAHRPMFDDWALTFTLMLDDTIVGVKLLRQIVDDAGKRVGLGDFRPAKKGPYGKYSVVQWEVQSATTHLQQAAE